MEQPAADRKAAQEMQARIQELLQSPAGDMWCGTFHGLAHRTLKRFYKEAGLISGFTILDSDDQLRIVKRLVKEASLDDAMWPPKQIQWQINNWKDGSRGAHESHEFHVSLFVLWNLCMVYNHRVHFEESFPIILSL